MWLISKTNIKTKNKHHQKVSEYNQEIHQSHTEDQPTTHEEETQNNNRDMTSRGQCKHSNEFSRSIAEIKGTKYFTTKHGTNKRTPLNHGSDN